MLPTFGQLYNDTRTATALNSAVERGVKVTVAVSENPQVVDRLTEKLQRMELRYSCLLNGVIL